MSDKIKKPDMPNTQNMLNVKQDCLLAFGTRLRGWLQEPLGIHGRLTLSGTTPVIDGHLFTWADINAGMVHSNVPFVASILNPDTNCVHPFTLAVLDQAGTPAYTVQILNSCKDGLMARRITDGWQP